jgi:hypothetical protein
MDAGSGCVNCVHGIDERFCAICSKPRRAASPARTASAGVTLDEILAFLNDRHIRATYGAVGEVVGVIPRSLGALLGTRRPEASWIVNAADGLPTGYAQDECHPALFSKPDIIATGRELVMRLTVWRATR